MPSRNLPIVLLVVLAIVLTLAGPLLVVGPLLSHPLPPTSAGADLRGSTAPERPGVVPETRFGSIGGLTSVPVLFAPDAIAFDAANGDLYVADGGSGYVSVIDGTTNLLRANVAVGFAPTDVVVDPKNGDIYVENAGSANVSVLDATANTVVATVVVGPGAGPMGVDPVSGDVYVPNATGAMLVISGANQTVFATFPVGVDLASLDMSLVEPVYDPVNGEVYALGYSAYNATCGCGVGLLEAISGTRVSPVASIPVGDSPTAVTVGGTNGEVYVANGYSGTLTVISPVTDRVVSTVSDLFAPTWLTYDPTMGNLYVGEAGNTVEVLSTATLTVVGSIGIGPGTGPMEIDPGFGELAIASGGSLYVPAVATVISLALSEVTTAVHVGYSGLGPKESAFDTATGALYVTNSGSGNVSVIGPYALAFTETGLRPGTSWSVSLVGVDDQNRTLTSSEPTITFLLTNGTYDYSASIPSLTASSAASGTIVVDGGSLSVTIPYVWSDGVWAWLVGGALFVAIGGWVAVRWRGSGISPLRREYAALFHDEMNRSSRERLAGEGPHRKR